MAKDNTIKRIKIAVSKIRVAVKELGYLSDEQANKLLGFLNYLSDRNDKESINTRAMISQVLKKRKSPKKEIAFTEENRSYIKHELSSLPFLYAYKDDSFQQRFGVNRVKFYYTKKGENTDDDIIVVLEVYPNKIMKYIISGDKRPTITGLNNAQYLKEKEGISYEDALKVVLAVYDPEYVVEDQNLLQIIDKYLEVLKSNGFRDFLDKGIRIVQNMNGKDADVSFYENIKKAVKKATSDNSKSDKIKK